MRKIDVPDLAPGVCIVCEQAHQAGLEWVDTMREFDSAVVTPITGRRYLCSRCVLAAAAELGLRPTSSVEEAELRAAESEAKLVALRAHVGRVAEGLAVEALVLAEGRATVPVAKREAAEAAVARQAEKRRETKRSS